jgi:signal transduction histidine kinase
MSVDHRLARATEWNGLNEAGAFGGAAGPGRSPFLSHLPSRATAAAGDWPAAWVVSLPSYLLLASVVLRSILLRDEVEPSRAWLLLSAWTLLFLAEPKLSTRSGRVFHPYVAVQAALVFILMAGLGLTYFDYYALLFAVLTIQVFDRSPEREGIAWLVLFSLLIAGPLLDGYGLVEGVMWVLIYSAVNVFVGLYGLGNRRAREVRARNERLARQLAEDNRRLEAAARQVRQLAVTRARHRLARELHDSVTQTVFSMSLATESAVLLLQRGGEGVEGQLDHVAELARGALLQMQVLISELRPPAVSHGLASAMRQDVARRILPAGLSLTVESKGEGDLRPEEEEALFSIAREAVNNVVKHAQAARAIVRLNLDEPIGLEVTDDGVGFHPDRPSCGVGLTGMRERAAEIGWRLDVVSSPGAGTHVRVTKSRQEERQG